MILNTTNTDFINKCIYIHIIILNYITNAPTFFGACAPSSGSFDIVFAKVTNIKIIKM